MKRTLFFIAVIVFCAALFPLIFVADMGKQSAMEARWASGGGASHRIAVVQGRLGVGDIIRLPNGQLSYVEFVDRADDLVTVILHSGGGRCATVGYSFEELEGGGVRLIYRSDSGYREAKQEIDSPRCGFW